MRRDAAELVMWIAVTVVLAAIFILAMRAAPQIGAIPPGAPESPAGVSMPPPSIVPDAPGDR